MKKSLKKIALGFFALVLPCLSWATEEVTLPDPVYTNTLEGDSLLFVDGTAYTATSYDTITDIDGGTNIALYEFKDKDDNDANVARSANIVKEHTVSGWFKLNETGKTTTLWVVRNDATSYSGYIVQITDAGKLKIARASGTGIQDSAIESTDVAVNDTNWHHITISFDWYYKSDAADYQWHRLIPRAYIDGTPISIDEESLGVVCSVNGAIRCDYFHIGAGVTAAGVTVYGATLTAEQVAAIDRTANLAEVPTVENPLEPIYTNTLGVGVTFEAYDGNTYRAAKFDTITDIDGGTNIALYEFKDKDDNDANVARSANIVKEHTVSGWFKLNETGKTTTLWVVRNDATSYSGYIVQITDAGKLKIARASGTGIQDSAIESTDVAVNDTNWHHITISFDWYYKSDAADYQWHRLIPRAYIDGTPISIDEESLGVVCSVNGAIRCDYFYIGAGVTAAGLAVYGDVIPADDVFAYYANSNAYLAEPPTATAVTIEEASVNSSNLVWTNGTPTAELAATITANTATTITLDNALEADILTIAGEKVIFAGATDLTASSTTIQSDLDVSALTGTVNLGAVLIEQGKTLTVSRTTEWSAMTNNGTLAYKDYVPADFEYNDANSTVRFVGTATSETNSIRASNGTVEIAEGAEITVPNLCFLNRNDSGDRVTLNVAGTLNVNTSCTAPYGNNGHNAKKGILFGHYHGEGTYNITGNLIGENTYLMTVYTAEAQTININGGSLRVRALVASNKRSTINLTNGGTLSLATWPTTSDVAQNYGHGTVTTYNCTEEQTKGWTNPQAVSFTDATNGTTLDPASETIAFTGTITDGAEGGGAKIIVNDSGDGTGIVNLSSATLPDTLQYAVNAGTLILPAGKETTATINDGTLGLQLSGEQMVIGYTAQVPADKTVVFYGTNGTAITDSELVNGNTYTPALNTWTPAKDNTWSNTENWSNKTLPAEDETIKIDVGSAATTLTMDTDDSVGIVRVVGSGDGSLSIAGSNKLAITGHLYAETDVAAATDTLAAANIVISEDKTVTIENTAELTVSSIVGGTLVKNGSGALKLIGNGSITVDSATLNIAAGELKSNGGDGGGTSDAWMNHTTLIFGENATMLASNWVKATGTITLKSDFDFSFTEKPLYSNENNLNFVIGGTGSVTFNNVRGKNVQVLEGATYGVYDGGGGLISGSGTAKLVRELTLSAANTVAKIDVPQDISLILGNKAAIPAGALTGSGTVKIAAVANMPEVEIASNAWTGTVEITGDLQLANQNTSLEVLGHANSKLKISGKLTGYLAKDKTCAVPVELADGASISIDDGYSNGGYYTFAKLIGAGSLTHNRNLDYPIIIRDAAKFTGTLTITEGYTNAKIVIGDDSANAVGGAIVVSDADCPAVIATGKTWTAPNGVIVNGTIGGSGIISGMLTFNDGATLDASAGAVTVTGTVALPTGDGETVTVNASAYGTVLKATEGLDASKFALAQDQPGRLTVVGNELVYAVAITSMPDNVSPSANALTQISTAAAEAGVMEITSIVGAKLGTADDAPTVDVAGLELFEDIPVEVDLETRTATIKYAFGITAIRLEADGRVTVTATVSKITDGVATLSNDSTDPKIASGVTVELYCEGVSDPIGTKTLNTSETTVTITSDGSILGGLGTDPSLTKPLTIKVTNTPQQPSQQQ
ncbi:MAG: hypothetical protein Q4F99_02795 [bacterium]|nr:hypothetical protein [bacterium]